MAKKNLDVPAGAASLHADYIHPAFRGTTVAFHTLRLLKGLRAAAKQAEAGNVAASPHAAPRNMVRIAKAVLQGKRTVTDWLGESVNPFKVVGAWFKKLRGDGLGGIPQHLTDFHDRYNVETADRRHQLDAQLYDLIHDIHGKGDHAATDLKIRSIGSKLHTATDEQLGDLTTALRRHLAKRKLDVPSDWHTEALNSLHRLHQYALDRKMLKDEAHEQRRSRLTGPAPKREGDISWRDWFMGAGGLVPKRSDPMRLNREAATTLAALVRSGRHDLAPIWADAIEEAEEHNADPETLHHLRHGRGPFTIREGATTWARQAIPWSPMPHERHAHVEHETHGPGGRFTLLREDGPPDLGHYYRLMEYRTHDDNPHWNIPRDRTTLPASGFGDAYRASVIDHMERTSNPPVQLARPVQGLGHALRELASRNQRAREQAARALLRQAGEPGAVASVIAHHPELGFRAGVMAALATGDHYAGDAAKYLGAWHGSLTREADTIAFHAHDDGADRLHVVHAPVDASTLADALRTVGIHRFSIRPGENSTAFVFDPGATFDLTSLARNLRGRSIHTSGTGQRLGEGSGTDYREHIRSVEASAGASPAPERVSPARLARLPAGAIRAKELGTWTKVLGESPTDRVRRGVFADWLEERGHHHDDATLERLRSHDGPVFVVRHPRSRKVVAVPGHPIASLDDLDSVRHRNGLGPVAAYGANRDIWGDPVEIHHGPHGVVLVTRPSTEPAHHMTLAVDPSDGRRIETLIARNDRYGSGTPRPLAIARRIAQRHAFGD